MSACTGTTFEQGCKLEWHSHPEIWLPPHWIPNIIGSECCQSDDACMPLYQRAVNLMMPVCHWIRALSIWQYLYAIGSERCQSDDACMPLDQSAVNLTMPVCHCIRELSIWRCLYAIGSERCQSDDACMPLDQSVVNLMMPVCHWIRALSIWWCLYAIGSERCHCCLIVACLHLERSSTPLDQWTLSVLWQANAFFCCHAVKLSSKANLKYRYSK